LTLERNDGRIGPAEVKALTRGMASNAQKLHRLLTNLLDLDRLSRSTVEPQRYWVDVRNIALGVVNECTAEGHPIEVDAEPTLAKVDGAQVERIMENLVTNAVRYTPEGTPIWVCVAWHQEGVLVTVEDAGPGIPPEIRETIFEPFRQGAEVVRHSPGVGIGLSLVARFAELHGGRAWVDEREGGGASFKVFLTSPPPPSDASDEIAQESVTETANVP
jgi:signal transduction histidine kinase